jgi:hypothetical protein
MRSIRKILAAVSLLLIASVSGADPSTQPAGKLPHIQVDAKAKEVRVDCEAVKADYPLEFLAVVTNTNDRSAGGYLV